MLSRKAEADYEEACHGRSVGHAKAKRKPYIALTICSVIFLASPSSIIVLSR